MITYEVFRRWGKWEVLSEGKLNRGDEYKVKLLHIEPGKSISRQYHDNRDEYWTIMQGQATIDLGHDDVVAGREEMTLRFTMIEGESERVPRKFVHKITNEGDETLIILELQMGKECDEEDITRLEKIDGEG